MTTFRYINKKAHSNCEVCGGYKARHPQNIFDKLNADLYRKEMNIRQLTSQRDKLSNQLEEFGNEKHRCEFIALKKELKVLRKVVEKNRCQKCGVQNDKEKRYDKT